MKRIISLLMALLLVATIMPVLSVEAEALAMKEAFTEYKIIFSAGDGKGGTNSSSYQPITSSVYLPSASACGFSAKDKDHSFAGWTIGGITYGAGDTYTFSQGSASRNSEDQYSVYATAKWTKNGSGSSSSSSSSGSSSSSSSGSSNYITVTYSPGEAKGSLIPKTYSKNTTIYFISNPYTYEGYTFEGWLIKGYEQLGPTNGIEGGVDFDITVVAQWKAKNTGVTIITPGQESSSSGSSSKTSSASSSKSSSASSSKSSSKSSSASSSKSSSSSSSVSESSSSSSMSESSSSSSIPETPVVDVFEPISLAYSINGDIPVTAIEFLLKEDIGETPQLQLSALDGYSTTDAAAANFISSGDALAAFELSLAAAGATYNGPAEGTVTFTLNGTQADAQSNYKSYVLAMVHTTEVTGYSKPYYMTDGENVFLYEPETAFKTAVNNVAFVEEEGVKRLVIRDVTGLSDFAYLADNFTIVEVSLLPSLSAASADIDVSSLSPVLLVQMEVGEGKSASGLGIPFWVWIIVAVIVLLIVALVVLYLINRKNEQRRYEARMERENIHQRTTYSSSITGFDED